MDVHIIVNYIVNIVVINAVYYFGLIIVSFGFGNALFDGKMPMDYTIGVSIFVHYFKGS